MIKPDRPRDRDVHTDADFVELICLLTIDRNCSRDYIRDYITDVTDKNFAPSDVELDDAFGQLAWRVSAFGPTYPFTLDSHQRVLTAIEPQTDEMALYVLLLLSANLPFIDKIHYKSLTDTFERVALAAFKRMWPDKAVIRPFGKSETDYTGAKWERLNALGVNIGGRPACTTDTFRQQDSGDGGIDIVAWLPLDEHEGWNIPSALAQCACSRSDWSKKQSEISNGRLGRHLNPSHPWMELIFIPQCFRDNRGRWAVDGDIGGTIVVDRLRLLSHLDAAQDWPTIIRPRCLEIFLEMRLELV